MNNRRGEWMVIWVKKLLGIALVMAMLVVFTACSQGQTEEDPTTGTTTPSQESTEPSAEATEPSDDAVPPYEDAGTETTEPTEPPVQIETPEYELNYSGELKELIVVEELTGEDAGCLRFSVKLSEGEQTIFVLRFNSDQSELVTVLTDAEGNRIPVAFEMAVIPEGLSDADADLFYTAQDAVNEILASMKLK